MANKQPKEGVYYNPKLGRIVKQKGHSITIYWSPAMLDYLRRHFPTTLNAELAECLGVGMRTMRRKARELGLEKDHDWLMGVYAERRHMAHVACRRMGYPGSFRKGEHANPNGEFKKGYKQTSETKQKIAESMRRWFREHPKEASLRGIKIWEIRRRHQQENKK